MTDPLDPRPLVTIVLPAKDEERGIGGLLEALPLDTLHAMGFRTEVIVLDGNSKDETAIIARAAGATVIPDREPGKGAAFRHARTHMRGEYVVMLDADGTYASDAIPRVVARLAWGTADVVMGHRMVQPGAMPHLNRIGNKLLSAAASTLFLRRSRDVCTGLWGFRTAALQALPLRSRGFGLEAELFGFCARLRLGIAHLRVDYLPRHGPTKLNSTRDGARIARRLLVTRFCRLRGARVAPSPLALPAPLVEAQVVVVAEESR